MDVGGYDSNRAAWRVTFAVEGRTLSGFVPEEIVEDELRSGKRPEHEDVYRWLSDHAAAIEKALIAKAEGRPVRAPFDRVMLGED